MSPSVEQPPLGDQTTPPRKRRKTQLACHPCRARKTGCDAQRPYCSSCVTRGWENRCGYPEPASQSSSALTLGNLEKRLRQLEQNLKGNGSASATVPPQSHDRAGLSNVIVSQTRPAGERIETSGNNRATTVLSSPSHIESSNSAFVEQIASVVGSGYDHIKNTGTGISVHQSTPDYNIKDLILPPRELADKYLHSYWELFHPIYPILHRPKFHAIYCQLWQPTTTSQRNVDHAVFYSTLNMVLALGCQRNEALEVEEREDLSNEFYRRSMKLVSLDTLDTSSLQIVQLLLLRGFYLLYTPLADRCWNTTGAAVRVAQAIGLQHSKMKAVLNQLEREMRRRVWHSCVLLDWMTSISFDRTAIIFNTSSVPLPESIDDEYLSETTSEGSQPPDIPSRLVYFTYSIKLLDIRRNVESQYGSQGKNRNDGHELGATLDIVSELDRFLELLPPHLQTYNPGSTPEKGKESCFALQAQVLKDRVMYFRLRFLRPFVLSEARRYINTPENNAQNHVPKLSSQDRLRQELCVLCVTTAHEALDELYKRLESVYRSSPWHTLYFAFASSSVLIAATLCPPLTIASPPDAFQQSWEKTLRIFAFHKSHVASAEKGLRTLENFKHHVDTRGQNILGKGGRGPRNGITSDVENMPLDASMPPPSAASNPISTSQPSANFSELETNDFTDLAPIDEGWLFSQDFFFDDDMAQWELYSPMNDPIF